MEIQTEALDLAIDDKKIVEKITLEVKNKEFVGLIGPNGSGKSTILRALYRSLEPQSGRIFFDGEDLKTLSLQQTAQRLGVMKQNSTLNFDFKVLDLVLMGRTPYKKPLELDSQADYELAKAALAAVGLNGYEDRLYNQLSGGEQQRVSIARALAKKPKLLLCDEPTGALDFNTGKNILKLLQSKCREDGMTVILITHNSAITPMANRVISMRSGQVVSNTINKEPMNVEDIEW